MIVSCFPPAFPQLLSSKAVRTDSSHPPQEGLSLFQVQSELTGTVPTDPPAHSAKQTMTSPSTSLNHKFYWIFVICLYFQATMTAKRADPLRPQQKSVANFKPIAKT